MTMLFLPRCMSPLMARMRSPDRLSCCPVIGIDRKRLAERPTDAIDPKRNAKAGRRGCLEGRTDVQREPGHVRFDLSRPPAVLIGLFVWAAGKVGSTARVQKGIELSDFNPFEVPPPGRRRSASGLGQARARQRSPCPQIAVVLAWHCL